MEQSGGTCTAPAGMVLASSPTLGTVTGIGGTGFSATATNATCNGTGNSNCTVTVSVTSPAAQSANGSVVIPITTGITNPTTQNTTYYSRITTKDVTPTVIDGPNAAAFAILTSSSIAVTASVDPNFSFAVAPVTSGATIKSSINTDITTTENTIPFGNLNPGTAKTAAQDITVSSNASGGYSVTASHAAQLTGSNNPPLVSGNDDIDSFTGTNAAPSAWGSGPSSTTPNTNTGFFGYTTSDATLCAGTPNRFATADTWAGTTTTGQEVACSTTAANAETTRIGYRIQVDANQPSGAYSGSVILIATPTY